MRNKVLKEVDENVHLTQIQISKKFCEKDQITLDGIIANWGMIFLLHASNTKKDKYEEIEERLIFWFTQSRFFISGITIREKAKEIAKKMNVESNQIK